jgi:hypothetical protein
MIFLCSFQSYAAILAKRAITQKGKKASALTKTHERAGLPINCHIAPQQKPRQTLSISGRANL